jgi:hypothetical protein
MLESLLGAAVAAVSSFTTVGINSALTRYAQNNIKPKEDETDIEVIKNYEKKRKNFVFWTTALAGAAVSTGVAFGTCALYDMISGSEIPMIDGEADDSEIDSFIEDVKEAVDPATNEVTITNF